jgi:hypothetical protein
MRERDVRNAIAAALLATNAFDANGVWLVSPEDQGQGTDVAAAVWIEPTTGAIRDEWDAQPDGGVTITAILKITFSFRAEDPQSRDEGVERLFDVACNALNGQVLVEGFTIPAWTRFQSWTWSPPGSPERQIVSMFRYDYEIEGWDSFDTTE